MVSSKGLKRTSSALAKAFWGFKLRYNDRLGIKSTDMRSISEKFIHLTHDYVGWYNLMLGRMIGNEQKKSSSLILLIRGKFSLDRMINVLKQFLNVASVNTFNSGHTSADHYAVSLLNSAEQNYWFCCLNAFLQIQFSS